MGSRQRARYAPRVTVLRIENGDLYLPAGATRLEVIGEPEATLQLLRDSLRVAVGDWFLDLTAGLDREVLLGKLSSLIPPEVEIRRVLARVPAVTSVIRVKATRPSTRGEATALGEDVLRAWDAAPGRVLHVAAQVTTRTAGALDLGVALPIAPGT